MTQNTTNTGETPTSNAILIWGYYTYPAEGGNPTDTRLGEEEIRPGSSLASLRARATRHVKKSGDLHAVMIKYVSEWDIELFADPGGVDIHAPEKLWEHRYSGGEWEDWRKPIPMKDAPAYLITSRWKYVDRRKWHRTYSLSGGKTGLPMTPDIKIYYAVCYTDTFEETEDNV